jgi:ribonucleoside-diphosphate reductase alpha chain
VTSRIDIIGQNGNDGLHYIEETMQANKILSAITVFNKYAKFQPEVQRREDWGEIVLRNMEMHIAKYPLLEEEIKAAYKFVFQKKVLPSMRSLQFGGRPIELAHNRIYNCAFMPNDHSDSFSELMFLLLGGTGGGLSVQSTWINQLPTVLGTTSEARKFLIGDSIEGWADAIKVLMEAHFYGKQTPVFDYRDIREKGAALITTGGKAPGPEPLRKCIEMLDARLSAAKGRQLRPIEVLDMDCIIADAVLAGGIRRAALIVLYDRFDQEMLTAKSGNWWEEHPYRARANLSAVLPRGEVSKEEFYDLMKVVEASGSGEPGIYWTSNELWGTNPCCEIALQPFQFCNLCEVNADGIIDQEDLEARAKAASFIGTLQAGYTDFHYLRPIWKQTTEQEALIGVGITGIGSGHIKELSKRRAADVVVEENRRVAALIGINAAARTTTVKPSGTSSLVVGSSSGVHAWHAAFYIRRMRVGKNEALYAYLKDTLPELVEDDKFNPNGAVLSFPQAAPEGAILRSESPLALLERVREFNLDWVRHGHVSGDNTHNVSCTISLKDEDWPDVTDWMWYNRNEYNGISVLPYDGGTYIQAPFEDITEDKYNEMLPYLTAIDLSEVLEEKDNTDLAGEVACGAGGCEIT